VKSCSVTVNTSRSILKFTFPSSPKTSDSPLGIHEDICFHHINSIRFVICVCFAVYPLYI
jgi:hypothetical protein